MTRSPDDVRPVRSRWSRTRFAAPGVALAVLVFVLAGCTAGSSGGGTAPTSSVTRTSAGATSTSSAPPVTAGSDYLALGDSVSFGYREPNARPAPDYADARDFVGYPELVAKALHLHVANAACPGETSASFVDATAASFGCERGSDGAAARGYRTNYPLHVAYDGAQLAYAVHYLTTHRDTRLVTLMIGANDAFRCAATTSDRCTSEITGLLGRVGGNVRTILRAVRDRAGYHGRIVLVTYYASQYGGLAAAASSALNSALTSAASGFGVTVADGFGALEQAAKGSGGDSCAAGLLTTLTSGGCGIHPSTAGQRLLARAVEQAVGR